MAGISQEDIQRVREANDLVDVFAERVPLQRRGREFWCCCPFHQEKTPSCHIVPDTQVWHCFGCGEGGDLFSFIQKIDDVSFPEAVRYLADRAGIEISDDGGPGLPRGRKARLRAVCQETAEFYHTQLMRGKGEWPDKARKYLAGRGLGGETPNEWMLGYAPGSGALCRYLKGKGFTDEELVQANVAVRARSGYGVRDRFFERVMFPIFDPRGACIAFGGRVIGDGEPKYLNSKETPLFHKSQVLYGMDKAKAAMAATGTAVICEGYTDVIFLHKAGVTNAVATLGTALTMQHIRLISRHASKRIVYLFDGDEAGQRAANRALEFIDASMTPEAGKTRIELYAVVLPDNLDPADFVLQRGADALQEQLDNATPLLQFGIDRRLAKYSLDTPESRSRAVADALSVLAPIKDSMLAKDYAMQISGRTGIREDEVLRQLSQLKKPRRYEPSEQGGGYGTRAGGSGGHDSRNGTWGNYGGQYSGSGRGGSAASAGPYGQQAPGTAAAGGFGRSAAPVRLSEAETNRRRTEREFLSICAGYTPLAMQYMQQLMEMKWHDPLCKQAADLLADVLSKNPQATTAQVVSAAGQQSPQLANVLTSAQHTDMPRAQLATFLSEELSIGDLETDIDELKRLMRDPNMPAEESDLLTKQVIDLQAELRQLRMQHLNGQRGDESGTTTG